MKLGVAAIARPTFDVPHAEEKAAAAFAVVDALPGIETVGVRRLLLEPDDLDEATAALESAGLDALLVLQASFADSTLVEALAATTDAPITLWAFPEARTGGRLRLNSLCGINLAAFALRDRPDLRHVYLDPEDPAAAARLETTLGAGPAPPPDLTSPARPERLDDAAGAAARVAERLRSARIGVVGEHPTGFGPCRYDAAALREATGVEADAVPLPRLFERAGSATADAVAAVRQTFAAQLSDLDTVDQAALDRSLRIHVGLRDLARDGGWDALATRCWPECFTEFGGAACAPQSLLNQAHGLPALCEADAYGAVTSLILQELTGTPSFVADLIHLDPADDTAVFWHCGLAPAGMADPDGELHAGIHSNRRLPLLYEFALAPGRVTIARLSQSRGLHRMVIGGAEMLSAPPAFSGTSGVARLDRPAGDVLDTIVAEGLEHHYGIVYGDVRDELHAVAAELALPVVEL